MKTHTEYLNEKDRYSYKLFKKNKIFKKVKAIILDENNNVILIKFPDNGIVIPGGGVEPNESLADAVARESLEETGLKVEPIKVLCKNFYTRNVEYNGNKFVSRVIEYYFLCKKIETVSLKYGLEGEFDKEILIKPYPIDKLKRTRINKRGILRLKKYIESISNGGADNDSK